jgi:hypothetical protein
LAADLDDSLTGLLAALPACSSYPLLLLLLLPLPHHLQVVNQPGLEDVFADLLEYEDRTGEELGAELYMEHCPAHLEGEA